MAITFSNQFGSTVRPGAYPQNAQVEQDVSNLATSGVITLVGEADAGPGYLDETDLTQNFFAPTDFPLVRAKYRSGRLVDAAFGAMEPSQDTKIPGAPLAVYLVKTNRSAKAQATLTKVGGGTYHYLADRSYGDFGNLISYEVAEATAEVVPTTGPFTMLVPNNTTDVSFRVSGGSSVTYQLATADLPNATVTGIAALSGVIATGGTNRNAITVSGTLTVSGASGNQITVTRSIAWATTPTVGDSAYIVAGSVIQGGSNENRGSYVVTAATSTTVTLVKLLDAAGAAGAITAPANVAAAAIAAVTDIQFFAPVTVSLEAGDPIDGVGKSLEWNELTSSTGRMTDLAYQLNTTKVTFISKSSTPAELTSSAEYQVTLADARAMDNVSELSATLGGEVVMSIGYTGTTATCTITSTALTTSVTGGSGANLNLLFSRYVTLADLVAYIDAQTGYSATLLLPQYGGKPPGLYLDQVTAKGICTTFGNESGRFKVDAWAFYDAVGTTSLVQLGTSVTATTPPTGMVKALSGLPAAQSGYLAAGAKNGTTQAELLAAIDATEKIAMNFGVLCISQNATDDITLETTESSSTYLLEAALAYARRQAEALGGQFRRKPRMWFGGVSGSYVSTQRPLAIRQSTQGLLVLTFQDVLALGPSGSIVEQQPWYGAVLAAAMQAAAGTGGIVHREPTQNGVLHLYGDFDAGSESAIKSALQSGLLPLAQIATNQSVPGAQGRWMWESDQTCYVRDTSWFYNSLQARYLYDQLRMFVALGVEAAVVGEQSSDVDAVAVKRLTESYLAQAKDRKFIAADDEAPRGFVSVTVTQTGPAFKIAIAKAKLAGLIYFVDIGFSVAQIRRAA